MPAPSATPAAGFTRGEAHNSSAQPSGGSIFSTGHNLVCEKKKTKRGSVPFCLTNPNLLSYLRALQAPAAREASVQREPRAPGRALKHASRPAGRRERWLRPPPGETSVLLGSLLRNKGPVSTQNLRRLLKDPSAFEQKVLEVPKRQAAAPNVCPPSTHAHLSVLTPTGGAGYHVPAGWSHLVY